jgi:hypothetical protein
VVFGFDIEVERKTVVPSKVVGPLPRPKTRARGVNPKTLFAGVAIGALLWVLIGVFIWACLILPPL